MRHYCQFCKNTEYCPSKQDEPGLVGCTSGEALGLPEVQAKAIANQLTFIAEKLNKNSKEYIHEVVSQLQSKYL